MKVYQFDLIPIDGNFICKFEIDQGLQYKIVFSPSIWSENELIYELSFQNELELSKSPFFDPCIQATIIAIIQNFITLFPNYAVGYMCDSSDGIMRSKARAKLFNRWFESHNDGDFVLLSGLIFHSTLQHEYSTGLLCSILNENKSIVVKQFNTLNQEFSK